MRKRGLTRRHRKPRGSCVPRPRMQRARPASRLQRFGEARRDRWRRIARVRRASSFSDRQRTARGSPPERKSIPPHMSSRNGMRFAASSPGTRPRPFAASHKRHPLPRPSPCNEQRVMGFSGIGTASRLRVVVHGHRRALPARRIRSPRFGSRSSSVAASSSIVVSRTTSCAPVQRYWRAPPLPTIVHTLDRQTSETRCTTPDVALANRAALRGLPTR